MSQTPLPNYPAAKAIGKIWQNYKKPSAGADGAAEQACIALHSNVLQPQSPGNGVERGRAEPWLGSRHRGNHGTGQDSQSRQNHGTGHGSAPGTAQHRAGFSAQGRITAPGTGSASHPDAAARARGPQLPETPGRAKAPSAAGTGLKRWGSRSPARPRRTDSAGRSPLRTGPPRRARTELCGRWGRRGERRPRGSGAGSGARRPRTRPAALPAPAPATAPRTPRRKCGPGRGWLTGASANRRARPRPAVAKKTNQLPCPSPRGGANANKAPSLTAPGRATARETAGQWRRGYAEEGVAMQMRRYRQPPGLGDASASEFPEVLGSPRQEWPPCDCSYLCDLWQTWAASWFQSAACSL